MRVLAPLIRFQAMLALLVSMTHAIHVGIVMSWGTNTHVAPLFNGLRPLVQSSPDHRITYLGSTLTATLANNHLDVVQVENTGIVYDERVTRNFQRAVSQTDTPIVTTDEFIRVFRAIGDHYEDITQVYLQSFRKHQFDLVICDFFDRACMDAALESGSTYAISGPIGILGAGDAWFVPDIMIPVPMETWIRSPLIRAQALPLIKFMLSEESRVKAIRDKLGFTTSSTYMDHFQRNLFLCYNVIGLDPARAIPPNIVVVGSSMDEATIPPLQPEMEKQLQKFQDNDVSVAYIAFGTAISLADSRSVLDDGSRCR